MKIVLSRKGFDSSYGRMPSPILPDGRLVPLPIPSAHDRHTFRDLNYPDLPVAQLLRDLSDEQLGIDSTVHLDPDLDRCMSGRMPGWRPSLGQTGAAQSHLCSASVTRGDIFLFFGWFREVELRNDKWRFRKDAPHLHVIFGWLEIDGVLPVVRDRARCLLDAPWIADHPHVVNPEHYTNPRNTVYFATERSRYNARAAHGGGRFPRYCESLRLTGPGVSRSIWSLPGWFTPEDGKVPLSYHSNPGRWRKDADRVTLKSVAKGQEFVLNCDSYPEADAWVRSIIAGAA